MQCVLEVEIICLIELKNLTLSNRYFRIFLLETLRGMKSQRKNYDNRKRKKKNAPATGLNRVGVLAHTQIIAQLLLWQRSSIGRQRK
jgi:hypothetical protein